jgi:hypothetical protein
VSTGEQEHPDTAAGGSGRLTTLPIVGLGLKEAVRAAAASARKRRRTNQVGADTGRRLVALKPKEEQFQSPTRFAGTVSKMLQRAAGRPYFQGIEDGAPLSCEGGPVEAAHQQLPLLPSGPTVPHRVTHLFIARTLSVLPACLRLLY